MQNPFDFTSAQLQTRYVVMASIHRHRSGQRWVGAESGRLCGGVSPLQPTRGLGSIVSSANRVWGRAPAENGFWRILKAPECSFLYLYDKIWA